MIRSAAGGESVDEDRIGLVEIESLSGISDSDRPVSEPEQSGDERSANEASAVEDDAGVESRIATNGIVVHC